MLIIIANSEISGISSLDIDRRPFVSNTVSCLVYLESFEYILLS